jgi:hypothetical protein
MTFHLRSGRTWANCAAGQEPGQSTRAQAPAGAGGLSPAASPPPAGASLQSTHDYRRTR